MVRLLVCIILLITPVWAQEKSDFLIGPIGGGLYGNYFGGILGGAELNLGRLELYSFDELDLYNEHIKLGSGYAYSVQAGSTVWIRNHLGLNGTADFAGYKNSISKSSTYWKAGLAWRYTSFGDQTRMYFNYVRQFRNGISANGTETARLQGGEFIYDTDMGCFKHFCQRFRASFQAGHVLTQSNPQCDGTFGVLLPYCKRTGAWGGGASLAWLLQFGERNL